MMLKRKSLKKQSVMSTTLWKPYLQFAATRTLLKYKISKDNFKNV